MLEWNTLAALMVLALAGTSHCVGMCGGFAAMVAARSRSATPSLVAYLAGKASSYAILGLGLSLFAGGVERKLHSTDSPELAHQFQSLLALLTGAALIVAGFAALGVRLPGRLRVVPAPVAHFFNSVRALPGLQGAFGVGLLTGLLPCGLSWSAFAIAANTSAPTAALGLFLFGLATAPGLLAVAFFGSRLPLRVRHYGPWLVGPLLILFGAFTALRGGLPGSSKVLPNCCQSSAGSE